MKSTLITILIIISNITFAQEYKTLDSIYYVDFGNISKGEIQIRKYLNFELNQKWWLAQKNYKLYRKSEDLEFINTNGKEAHKSEKINLSKGFYLLNNAFQKFGFEIDDKNQFIGNARYETKEEVKLSTIDFKKGKVILFETVNMFDEPIKKITINDSLYTEISYEKGLLVRKNIENITRGGGQNNEIRIHYFENGNIELEQNNIDNTFKTFYKNGKPKLYKNENSQEKIEYDIDGKKTEHTYVVDNKKCNEFFKNGIIQSKDCDILDKSLTYFYHYKNGKLDNYEILDRTKDEIKKFDTNNKLIQTSEAGKSPTISDKTYR
jgi:hypothetical protein